MKILPNAPVPVPSLPQYWPRSRQQLYAVQWIWGHSPRGAVVGSYLPATADLCWEYVTLCGSAWYNSSFFQSGRSGMLDSLARDRCIVADHHPLLARDKNRQALDGIDDPVDGINDTFFNR